MAQIRISVLFFRTAETDDECVFEMDDCRQ
jgi:hypothetical protein